MQSCYNTSWKCDGRETLTHGAVPWAGDSDACMPSAPHHGAVLGRHEQEEGAAAAGSAHPWHEAVVKSGLHLQCHAMQLGKSCSVGDCCLNRQAHIRIETVSAWAEMLTVPLGCPIGSRLQIKLV